MEANTLNTWEVEQLQKRERQVATSKEIIDHCELALKDKLEELGLTVTKSIISSDRYDAGTWHLEITRKDYADYYLELTAHDYDDYSRASLWGKTDRTITTYERQYSDGSRRTYTKSYKFEDHLSNQLLESIGYETADWRVNISPRMTFKGSKSPKLIQNDVLPIAKRHLEMIKLVAPVIDAKIKRENEVLELQALIDSYTKYKHGVGLECKDREFNIPNLGTVKISYYGDITLTRSIDKFELLKILQESVK